MSAPIPREWTNVAAKPENAEVKKKPAKYLPAINASSVPANEEPAKKKKKGKKARVTK